MKAEEEGEANMKKSRYLKGQRIAPGRIRRGITLQAIVENHFNAFNAARLREAARLFAERMLGEEVTVGMSLSGALTPAGLGGSCIVPLIENGFVDWIVSTGANLYHDAHFALGMAIRKGSPFVDDTALKREGVIRIYDILFDYGVLLDTDAFFREILRGREFQRTMGTSTLHHLIGTYLLERERKLGLGGHSLLAAASRYGVPVFTPSPGDSSIGMNIAALNMEGAGPMVDVSADVSESAAIVYGAKKKGGKSAVFIAGGGAPKNFLLQTEPHIQEILGIRERGHDYFLQTTDARPDTGGLSGATPSEAVSWGKVAPDRLPDSVVCYVDSTISLPLITAYALSKVKRRKPKRLFRRLPQLREELMRAHERAKKKGT